MTKAIDGLSIVFSTPADVRGIQAGNKKVESKLAAFENVLFRCTQRVDSLGEAPPVLVPSRAEALAACKNLEKGARLVRDGITQLQGGQGVDLLNRSSDPLGSGQDEVRRALLDLAPAQG
jgi:hypothetical protein